MKTAKIIKEENKVLQLLKDANGYWIPDVTFLRLKILFYTIRIIALERRGWIVERKIEQKRKRIYSFYKLILK